MDGKSWTMTNYKINMYQDYLKSEDGRLRSLARDVIALNDVKVVLQEEHDRLKIECEKEKDLNDVLLGKLQKKNAEIEELKQKLNTASRGYQVPEARNDVGVADEGQEFAIIDLTADTDNSLISELDLELDCDF